MGRSYEKFQEKGEQSLCFQKGTFFLAHPLGLGLSLAITGSIDFNLYHWTILLLSEISYELGGRSLQQPSCF